MTTRERRAAPRAPERVVVAVTDAGAVLQTETKNISASGAYCTLDRFVAPMTKLQLAFELPQGSRRAKIRCAGVVVRIEPIVASADRGMYNVAIFFTELAERDRSVIARFVRERLSTTPSTG